LTLLVGVSTRKGVWIGADSGSVSDPYSVAVPEPKVWRAGDWIVACGGDWRALELVRHATKFPHAPKSVYDAHKVVCLDVLDACQKAFDERGYDGSPDEDNVPKWFMLLGVRTATRTPMLFNVQCDHAEQQRSTAIGTGEEFALGVLAANTERSPEQRVRHALGAARKHYGILLPPFRVESL
jgi:hypothetical protein